MKHTVTHAVRDNVSRLLLLMLLAVLPLLGWAQQMVRGVVTDKTGDPLIGVSVLVKGTPTGVTTDIDGNYAIAARTGQTLVFSYVGMTTQEVKVGQSSTLDIVMQDNAMNLDDVVVVGYGKQKKSSITGAVSAIKGDELLVTPSTNITQILGGRVAGISSVQTSGEPGQDQASLRIRGSINSVTYIVDGIPRSINEVDPNDIESVSVLKDASATAVYGLKSSGGVIIVTTKKGAKRSPTITYDGQIGGSYNANFPKFMNAKEFMNYYNMADLMDQMARGVITDRTQYVPRYPQSMIDQIGNGDASDGYDDVNYIDKVFGTGTNTKHTLSMQGGNDRTTYYGSLGYMGQKGNIDNFTYDRYSMRLNLESKIGKYWTLSMGASGYVADTKTPGFLSGGADNGSYEVGYLSIAHQAIAMHPYLAERYNGLYTGIISANGSSPNSPLAAIYESGYKKTHAMSLSTNVSLRFDVPWVEGLSAKFTGAYDYSN